VYEVVGYIQEGCVICTDCATADEAKELDAYTLGDAGEADSPPSCDRCLCVIGEE
jgi:hypothetical protein